MILPPAAITVGINLNGKKILCDPWLVDGEYLGSWSHYPYYDLDANLEEIKFSFFTIYFNLAFFINHSLHFVAMFL